MHKISYTYTNKAKIVMYLMLVAACILRLILVTEISIYKIEGYEVYLLPTFLYYFVILVLISFLFFGYKFFYTLYDEEQIIYCNLLLNKKKEIRIQDIKLVDFGKKGISLYETADVKEGEKPALYIPFFRFGIPEAISTNRFFESMLSKENIVVKKRFKILPGYSKMWTGISMLYAFITFCVLIVCMEPLYTVIVLYMSFH